MVPDMLAAESIQSMSVGALRVISCALCGLEVQEAWQAGGSKGNAEHHTHFSDKWM